MSDLIKQLKLLGERSSADGKGSRICDEAADALESNAALIALLRASLRKAEDEANTLRTRIDAAANQQPIAHLREDRFGNLSVVDEEIDSAFPVYCDAIKAKEG